MTISTFIQDIVFWWKNLGKELEYDKQERLKHEQDYINWCNSYEGQEYESRRKLGKIPQDWW